MMRGEEDQTSRFLYELCSVLFAVLRSPQLAIPPSSPSSSSSPAPSPGGGGIGPAGLPYHPLPPIPRWPRRPQASPAAVASLMLGVSMALMLGGSVTFVLGCMLMPWVLGMLAVFYLAAIVSSLSGLGRAILFPSAPSAPREVKGELLSKLRKD